MKVFTLLAAFGFACTCTLALAQQTATLEGGRPPKTGRPAANRNIESGVFMKEGKMMALKDGTLQLMAETITMSDGTKVMPDGTVTTPAGKTLMLHNGQAVLLDGRVVDLQQKGKLKHGL